MSAARATDFTTYGRAWHSPSLSFAFFPGVPDIPDGYLRPKPVYIRPCAVSSTSRSAGAVHRSQVDGESVVHHGREKSSPADQYTEQAPPTSSPEHGAAEYPASSSSTGTAETAAATSRCTSTTTMGASSLPPEGLSYFCILQRYCVLCLLLKRAALRHFLQMASTTR